MTETDKTVPLQRTGYCGVCDTKIPQEMRYKDGHWPRTCGLECTKRAQSEAQHRAARNRRAAKAARVAKLEAARIAQGLGAPLCKVCAKGIAPMFTTDGFLRTICSKNCNRTLRAAASQRHHEAAVSRERLARKAVFRRDHAVFNKPGRVSKRICDVCCDLTERRHPVHGCPQCGLPYAKEQVTVTSQNMSPIALAARCA